METDSPISCIVFGGSGQLGRSIVRSLVAEGARVGFTFWQNQSVADELCDSLPDVIAERADARDIESTHSAIDRLVARLGTINGFVHCASICLTPGDPVPEERVQAMSDVSVQGWDELLSINVRSVYFACQRISESMRATGGGNIVLVGSISGTRPLPSPVHYATSKTALEGMGRSMAKELGADNVRVNVIEPGLLEAGISQTLPDSLIADYEKHCSLRRVGRMGEIASIVAWMATRNTYVSGQAILVDGAL